MAVNGYVRVGEIKGWQHAEADMAMSPPDAPPLASGLSGGGVAQPRWPKARVAAVEALWGEGFSLPGGEPETLRLVKPLQLSSSVTLLLLGGGLGGPAKAISAGLGAWVASFEADPELCALAASRALPADGGKPRVTVAAWDRAQPHFKPRSGKHALLLEAMRGSKPAPLLESLAGALSPDSQIVLTELVSDDAPSDRDREFAAWCRLENRQPDMPRTAEVTDALERLRFDVRVTEDMSDRHITQTLGGWRDAVHAMSAGPRPAAHMAAAFVTEAELWLLRIRLMRRLGVRLMRWHAIRSG